MSIRQDIDAAIDEELIKVRNGKREKPDRRLRMGTPAYRALGAETLESWQRLEYRGFAIEVVDDFDGWELRC